MKFCGSILGYSSDGQASQLGSKTSSTVQGMGSSPSTALRALMKYIYDLGYLEATVDLFTPRERI